MTKFFYCLGVVFGFALYAFAIYAICWALVYAVNSLVSLAGACLRLLRRKKAREAAEGDVIG